MADICDELSAAGQPAGPDAEDLGTALRGYQVGNCPELTDLQDQATLFHVPK